jgi:hypothetical protein
MLENDYNVFSLFLHASVSQSFLEPLDHLVVRVIVAHVDVDVVHVLAAEDEGNRHI